MFRQKDFDIIWKTFEQEEKSNMNRVVCGFRTGHRITIKCVPMFGLIEGHYAFRCLDCGMQYEIYKDFTPREQKLMDDLNKGAKNEMQ